MIALVLVLAVGGCSRPAPAPPAPTPSAVVTTPAGPAPAALAPVRPRGSHTATLLPDGRVLLAGGCAVDGCVTAEREPSSEFYLPGHGFVAGPPMVQPRQGHTATLLADGRVLIVGGWAREGTAPLAEAEVFDPVTGGFRAVGSLRTGRGGHTASLLPDGRVLVAGGWFGSRGVTPTVEIFDPSTERFSDGPALPQPRDAAVAVGLPDGDILLIGGRHSPAADAVTSSVRYDTATGSWSTGPSLATPRLKHAVAALPDGRFLVLGGTADDRDLLASTELLDAAGTRFTPGPAMSSPRYKFSGAVTVTTAGSLVVAGGRRVDVLSADGKRFDAVTPAGSVDRWFASATALPGGDTLVVGGYDERIRVLSDALLIPAVS